MTSDEQIYAIALSVIASPSMHGLWEKLETSSSASSLYRSLAIQEDITTQNCIARRYPGAPLEAARRIGETAIRSGVAIVDFWDDRYPPRLKEIHQPPLVLYCRGNTAIERPFAIVGTRKSDSLSSHIAWRISRELAGAGFTVVSGMAVGIDREAHRGALQDGYPTVGVLANGIDIIYPVANRDLHTAIMRSPRSTLLSEYPPGILADRWTFVRRNRIISGISLGTLVVKAGEKSGALITARYALDQNREVFACPGHAFDSEYAGCHNLIKSGAIMVSNTGDILREFALWGSFEKFTASEPGVGAFAVKRSSGNDGTEEEYADNSIEGRILSILAGGRQHVDSLVRLIGGTAREVNETLALLEISGLIERDGNMILRR